MNILSYLKQKFSILKSSIVFLRLKSSMTIYLTLVLVVIMALIFTLIESGRVSAINARLRSITFMAADSAFAEFAQPVFDDYGVMFLWADEEEYLEKFNGYISGNVKIDETGVGDDLDLYGMRFAGSELKSVDWLTDEDGQPFAEQVHDYMKVHAVENLAEELLSRAGFFEQTEKARSLLGTISEYQEDFVKVGQSVSDLSDKMNHIKDLAENPKTLFEEMEGALERYETGNDPEEAAVFSQKKKELEESRSEISKELTEAQQSTEAYYQNVEKTKAAVNQMKEELDLNEEEYDPEIYQAIQKKIEEMEAAGNGEDVGYLAISENAAAAAQYQEKLESLDLYFAETAQDLTAENVNYYQSLTEQYRSGLDDFAPVLPDIGPEEAEGGEGKTDFLVRINNQYRVGLLDLLAEDISEKQIDKSHFPSVTCKKGESAAPEESAVDKTVQKALFSEYVVEHFGNYREGKEGTALDYEAEYILSGKDNDRDNLSSVATKLVLLRCGANMIGLLLDSTKQAEIKELAAAISVGQMYIYKIAEGLITLAWAMAEAMLDVKALFAGKRIVGLKQKGDWFLSIEGLQNFSGEELTGAEDGKGLSYEDYLRILLLMENRRCQRFQTMDLIQANMCKNENPAFRIKDCMIGASAEAEFHAPFVFAGLAVVRKTADFGSGAYRFRFTQDYFY